MNKKQRRRFKKYRIDKLLDKMINTGIKNFNETATRTVTLIRIV